MSEQPSVPARAEIESEPWWVEVYANGVIEKHYSRPE
jgi:hypothetical protein